MDTIRRVRAARGSLNLSLTEFAKAIGVGRQTLVRIESGEREPKSHEYASMAEVTGLPVEFFTTGDLRAALAGADQDPTLSERVAALERDLEDLRTTLRIGALERAATQAVAEERGTGEAPAVKGRRARRPAGTGR